MTKDRSTAALFGKLPPEIQLMILFASVPTDGLIELEAENTSNESCSRDFQVDHEFVPFKVYQRPREAYIRMTGLYLADRDFVDARLAQLVRLAGLNRETRREVKRVLRNVQHPPRQTCLGQLFDNQGGMPMWRELLQPHGIPLSNTYTSLQAGGVIYAMKLEMDCEPVLRSSLWLNMAAEFNYITRFGFIEDFRFDFASKITPHQFLAHSFPNLLELYVVLDLDDARRGDACQPVENDLQGTILVSYSGCIERMPASLFNIPAVNIDELQANFIAYCKAFPAGKHQKPETVLFKYLIRE